MPTYKMTNPESKLVRYVLETNGVYPTPQLEEQTPPSWSILWSSNSVI